METVYGAGALAYADFFGAGLVPCKVLAVAEPGDGRHVTRGRVVVRLTATRGPWKRGEVLTVTGPDAVPRDCVRTIGGRYQISTGYRWE